MAGEWGMRLRRNGVEEMNPFTNMGRFAGSFQTSANSGSVTLPGIGSGSPNPDVYALNGLPLNMPDISISGTVVSYNFPTTPRTECIIMVWVQ